jgi:hypothetical protein
MPTATLPTKALATELRFAQSESKAVGLSGGLMMGALRNNAPRVVGALKLGMDISAGLSGNPWLIGYALFAGVGRILLMIYGSKANQQKAAAAKREGESEEAKSTLEKVTRPREYPVEAAAGLSVIAETLAGPGYAASRFLGGEKGFTPLILGIIAIWSYANILFGKEKKKDDPAATPQNENKESLTFASSQSKAMGITGRVRQWMKNNPVRMSSIMQLSVGVGMLAGSLIEGGYPTAYLVAACFGIVANIVQALFVTKQGFNVEGARDEAKNKPPATFEEKLAARRGGESPQPAL